MQKAVKLRPLAIQWLWSDRAKSIKERDCLTRFSFAHGPLCRWPGASVDDVRARVVRDMEKLRRKTGAQDLPEADR